MEKNIIAAISDNRAIGISGTMPWHISEDLRHFKRTTFGGTVIMGRKTFLSIGRPLPGRTSIVITRGDGADLPEGVIPVHSVEDAFAAAASVGKPCFVVGGGEIYAQTIPLADTLYITHIHATVPDADTFFPEISPEEWEMTSVSETMRDPETGYDFEFSVYRRKL